jgi:hypothetical protein
LLREGHYICCPATTLYQWQTFDCTHGLDPAFDAAAVYELDCRIAKDFPVYSNNDLIAECRAWSAVRRKKDSSVSRAVDLVKYGQADAIVSAGHTRRGIAAVLPTEFNVFV